MYKQRLVVLGSAVLMTVAMAGPGFSGSTIGGNPTNGGGQTFSAPSGGTTTVPPAAAGALATAVETVAEVLGADATPAQVETAITTAIATSFPAGTGAVRLAPLPGQSPAQTVITLTNLIQTFAAQVGLPAGSPAIQQLLAIAQSADS